MKQTTNNSKNTKNKKANQKQVKKSKKAEANARRKANKSWEKMEHTPRYRSASLKEVCDTITKKIEIEVLHGDHPQEKVCCIACQEIRIGSELS